LDVANTMVKLAMINMWERACSRMRSVSQWLYQLTRRFREQARSHI
jgi:hypothetical protein